MKDKKLMTAAISLLMATSGCGNTVLDSSATDFPVTVSSEIQKLEKGFSAVGYDGNYGFERFLEQGGADSDKAVKEFLANEFMAEAEGVEMNTELFGCSTLSVPNAEGGYLFGRNFDWNACDALVVLSDPQEGYASVSTVNLDFIRQGTGAASYFLADEILTAAALYAPLDGMNEKGLCVSVNMIQDGATIEQNTEKPDLTTTTAIRLLLNKAATVEEALALLGQYDLHASMNYMVHFAIADAAGNSVAVEYIENEMTVVKTPVLTNFYLTEGEKQGVGTSQSHERFEILTDLTANKRSMTQTEVRDALDRVSKDNFGEFESTEWSIVFDQSALTAVYYHRENYEKAYLFKIAEK